MKARPGERAAEVGAVVEAVAAWARRHDDVRAVALAGSQARGTARPDSDLDFVVLTDSPARYLSEDRGLADLTAAEAAPPVRWGVMSERRLTLASGLELDLGFGLPSWAATDPVDPGTRRVVADGIRILHDRDHLLADLALACGAAARRWLPPSLTLRAPGIELRDWIEDEAPALRTVCGDPDVCRFTSVPWTYAPAAARAWVDRLRDLRTTGEGLALAITAPGRRKDPLGTVNLGRFSADGRDAALGYWLLPAARRRGLATAAAAALCRWGFERLDLERIELAILPENAASHRLAKRLGARSEGVRRGSHIAEGRAWEMAIYALDRPTSVPAARPSRGRSSSGGASSSA